MAKRSLPYSNVPRELTFIGMRRPGSWAQQLCEQGQRQGRVPLAPVLPERDDGHGPLRRFVGCLPQPLG